MQLASSTPVLMLNSSQGCLEKINLVDQQWSCSLMTDTLNTWLVELQAARLNGGSMT